MRDLSGAPALGLALGGGGTLGVAHVGVLEVLRERGISPAIVVGTSSGALVGAAYALGTDPARIEELVLGLRWSDVANVRLRPGAGLVESEALRGLVAELGGADVLIEDMPIRFAAVATDLAMRRARIIDRGPLDQALRASISVPGLFRPVRLDGRMLADGGLMANLPIDAALRLGASPVIAVRVAREWDVPGFASAGVVRELEQRPDVIVVNPDLRRRQWWQTTDLPGLITAGRKAAESALGGGGLADVRLA